jgi:hypothetical protein
MDVIVIKNELDVLKVVVSFYMAADVPRKDGGSSTRTYAHRADCHYRNQVEHHEIACSMQHTMNVVIDHSGVFKVTSIR